MSDGSEPEAASLRRACSVRIWAVDYLRSFAPVFYGGQRVDGRLVAMGEWHG